ncbi:MAG: HDIG domain-containing metalloprotein [Thermoproteota archaeon]
MDREEALNLVNQNVSDTNLYKHMLAVEAIMKELANYLGEDANIWGMCGLLHDIDFEMTNQNPKEHGLLAEKILFGKVDEKIIRAIKAHNSENTDTPPQSKMEICLISADSVSGLLIASALIMPSKRLEDLKLETVIKKFKDKAFARGSSRERMLLCESAGIQKEKLFEIGLRALKSISDQLGL